MSNAQGYRAAVLGLGAIGAGKQTTVVDHVLGGVVPHTHVGAYLVSRSTSLVAVCDRDPARRQDFARMWELGMQEPIHAYTELEAMLQHENIDLLSIAVPDDLHASFIQRAAPHVRGILCEKPLATSVQDADAALEACRRHGTALIVNYTRRWIPLYREVHRLVQAGVIGQLNSMIACFSSSRPMLFRNGSHLLDLMLLYSGEEPTTVSATLGRGFVDYGPQYAGDGGTDPRTDPSGSALIRFAKDVVGHLHVSQGPSILEISLFGEQGRIRVGSHARELYVSSGDGSDAWIRPINDAQYSVGDTLGAVEELVAAISAPRAEYGGAEVARQSVAILQAILQSAHRGGAAVDVEPFPVISHGSKAGGRRS